MKNSRKNPEFIVGIGASAGGLGAVEAMLPGLPKATNTAWIFLQHSTEHESNLKGLLKKLSPVPVCMAANGMAIAGDTLYLCPPGTQCEVVCENEGADAEGTHFLIKPVHEFGPRHIIDTLFASLARHYPDQCAGVILSGTGRDGVDGLQAIKSAGGWVLVQDPETASFRDMPQNALDLFLADFVRSPETMGEELQEILNLTRKHSGNDGIDDQETFQILLEIMANETGFNFRRYKEPMLHRRIRRRMVANKVDSLGDYLMLVRKTPEEPHLLVKDIFITVTEFFRDNKVYKRLGKLFEQLLNEKTSGQTLRIWSVGCATGEEPYSIALLLAPLVENRANAPDIKIIASDIHEDNVRCARKGVYPDRAVANVPRELRQRYFDRVGDGWRVNTRLRDMVVFARHDAVTDTLFARMDLISCRNLLIYFERPTQQQMLKRFHYSLATGGYLLLGASEGTSTSEALFSTVDRHARLYQKRDVKIPTVMPPVDMAPGQPPSGKIAATVPRQQHMWELYFEEYAPAAVLVNSKLQLLHVHGNVQPYLSLNEGEFDFNLLHLARAELKMDMQMVLHQAQRTGEPARSRSLKLTTGGGKRKTDNRMVNLVAIPRRGRDEGAYQGELLLLFEEKPVLQQAKRSGGGAGGNEHVQALEEELAVTRDQLQASADALETANHELQSVTEEFHSTLEELQSANEEYQTTNEELESANEELITFNEEITAKSEELTLINGEMDSILNAVLAGIIVVDDNLHVLRYSESCRRLFDLWPDKIDNIHQLIARLQGFTSITPQLEKTLRTGQTDQLALQIGSRFFTIRLIPVREKEDASVKRLVIAFYDETASREQAIESELLAAIVRGSDDAIIVHDMKGGIRHWNDGAQAMFGYAEHEALVLNIRDLIARGEKGQYSAYVDELVNGGNLRGLELHGLTSNGRNVDISSRASVLRDHNGNPDGIAVIFRDISEKNAIEDKLNAVVESTPDPFIIVAADGTIQRVNRQAEVLFGYPRQEMVGQSFKLLVPERFRKQHDVYTRNYQQKPVMRQMGAGLELCCLAKSGEEVPVDISLSPVVVGIDTTIMVRFRDIRTEKSEQARLEETMRKADEANRTKTRFLAAASHDLRQPLQSISMYLGALAGKTSATDKNRIIEQARMAVDTSNKLLNALLNISKLESGRVQAEIDSFAVNRMLERVYNTEAPLATEKHQEFTMVRSSLHVTSDPALLEQLVTNLVANAIKYSPPFSHIVLGCRRRGDFLRIQVSDNGPGIKSTELDVIFDEYRQLEYDGHYLGKGLGLGLSIVKLIAELLHLKLEVSSIPGKGSSFSVLVPVARSRTKKKKSGLRPKIEQTSRTGRILLIEDDAAVLDSTTLFLEMSGFTVLTARDSDEAMAALENGRPEVIVTDYGLAQEENGIELVKRLRKKLQHNIPAIVITGDSSELRGKEAGAAGCEIIAKPVEARLLVQSLSDLLAKT